jgi:hypothetical protein
VHLVLCAGSFGSRRLEPSAERVLNGCSIMDCGPQLIVVAVEGTLHFGYKHGQSVTVRVKDESFRTGALPFMRRCDDRSMETSM